MTAAQATILARKIAAHARPAVTDDAAPVLARRLERAVRRAAMGFPALGLGVADISAALSDPLDAVIDRVPDTGMVAVVEGGGGARGCLAISHGLIDALIEVQTTGRVEAATLPPRPVTEIDQALSRDFLDLVLAAFAGENGPPGADPWPADPRFGSRVTDPGQLSLLLPADRFHHVRADITFDGVDRSAQILLALPACPVAHPDPGHGAGGADWAASLARVLSAASLPLEAVLFDCRLGFGAVARLKPGDVLPFAPDDLGRVRLVTASGHGVAVGRLGQIGGKRALRLSGAPPARQRSDGPEPAPPPATVAVAAPSAPPEPGGDPGAAARPGAPDGPAPAVPDQAAPGPAPLPAPPAPAAG